MGLGAAVVASCSHSSGATGAGTGLLYASTDTGLTAINPVTSQVAFTAGDAVAAPDWSRLYRVDDLAGRTRLMSLDPASGAVTATQVVPGTDLAVRAVSGDGTTVALGPPAPPPGYLAQGRTSTPLVIAEPA